MPQIIFQGKLKHSLSSFWKLNLIAINVYWRRLRSRPIVANWSANTEIGNLFWRHQFTKAMAMPDIADGRAYFDSLMTYTDEKFDVLRKPNAEHAPRGDWHIPKAETRNATMLYLHGGGYTFYSDVSRRFADLLADTLRMPVFAPNYRLTPEHRHPAQLEDALTAYTHLLDTGIDPTTIIVLGDSAGGHLTLQLLLALRDQKLPQPALAIGLCPWTHVGDAGESLHTNNQFDLVQGEMALQFGKWLIGDTDYSEEELSPLCQDLTGIAPLYLQAGQKEILHDMIVEFAKYAQINEAEVMLDTWPDMTHNFQANGRTMPQSSEALDRIEQAITLCLEKPNNFSAFPSCPRTVKRSKDSR